ncbi:oligopeptide ABC transporter substrate-binding protein [Dolosigranulum pigrum]|uniref:Solute-binding protein family 5 domain-containing protein n=1 Tax=Dolosigranulum pigrum ATCC 51524 TaxID=883103 RepID=H3NC39_9LACT|nr:oligopeptide ABC transporter substrate-binding protein [Dolosigranulum pigrum]EHR35272.1 hypothetical protein HMPREF9703_00120 [Dolosigranulum pigrum ATCC 51524]
MKLSKKHAFLATTASLTLLLAACGAGGGASQESTAEVQEDVPVGERGYSIGYEDHVINEGDPIEGGELQVGVVTESAWKGVFSITHYQDSVDSTLMGPMLGSLLAEDENYQLVGGEEYGTAADIEIDEEAKTVTLTVRDGVTWHDGEPLTANDIVFAHELVGHPDYRGVRYGDDLMNVVGMEEYHNGEADTISGLTLSDDNMSVTIEYKEFNPNMRSSGGGIYAYAEPRHHLEDVPVDKIEASDEVRVNPLGFGPFKVKSISDTAVQYEAYDDYYLGAPKVDGMVLSRISKNNVVSSLSSGQFDWVRGMPLDMYESYQDGIPGYTTLGHLDNYYGYTGFKLGEWNADEGKVNYNPDAKMADKNLRKAMAHALNIDEMVQSFYHGTRFRATTMLPPTFAQYFNEDIEGFPYDVDKANQLLDEAGYEWEGEPGEGYRLDKDGNPLKIKMIAMTGADESLFLFYQQSWAAIGLDVQYELLEMNAFYDDVLNDAEGIDVFLGAWGVGHDPTPHGLYGPHSAFNYSRYESEEHNELLADIQSAEAHDLEYRTEAFHKWQEFFMEEAPVFPTVWTTNLTLVNNRVSAYVHSNKPGMGKEYETYGLHNIELLADQPMTTE